MAYTAEKLIEIALNEVGYLEKASNSQLDNKTANAGYNNWTKYARDLHSAGYYNGNKNGYAWCDVWVDYCHWIAANKDAKEAQRVICQTGDLGAGCTYSMKYYKNAGRFYSSPMAGDQIFFGSGSESSHTGIVYKVDSSNVYTVEGNTSSTSGVVANGGGVFKKSYPLNYSKILGYGRPRYDGAKQNVVSSASVSKCNEIIKKGQEHAVKFTGVKIDIDGIVGKETNKMKARVLQHAMNLDYGNTILEDGVFGSKSKEKLGSHYVAKGERQYMVTAAQILLMLNGIDPNGVEYVGIYGNGLVSAAKKFFGDDGTKITASEFLKLIQ